MNRAVVVLFSLIANAIVSSRSNKPAPPPPADYSLGLFSTVDGAAPRPPDSYCTAVPLNYSADSLFDVRL